MYTITLSKTINLGDYNSFKAELTISKNEDEQVSAFILRAHKELELLVQARHLNNMSID